MRNKNTFRFKQFSIGHGKATMKVGTDGVLLGAWTSVSQAKRILDAGTGSGMIALMLAQRTQSDVHIDAIDLSAEDCEVAEGNIEQSPWPEKVKVHHSALQNFLAEPYDLIVSNPPFFINSYKPPKEKRALARHADTLTHTELLNHSKRLLTPTGRLNVVLPETEAILFQTMSKTSGWCCTRRCIFRSRSSKPPERILLELRMEISPLREEELVLYSSDLEWSDDYRALTKEFYLNA